MKNPTDPEKFLTRVLDQVEDIDFDFEHYWIKKCDPADLADPQGSVNDIITRLCWNDFHPLNHTERCYRIVASCSAVNN